MTSHYTWLSVTTLHDLGGVLGRTFGHFLLGSHNFTVTARGSWLECEVAPQAAIQPAVIEHQMQQLAGAWQHY
jgi:hypothetical protein